MHKITLATSADQSVTRLDLRDFSWGSTDIEHALVNGFERSDPAVFIVREYADRSAVFESVKGPTGFDDVRDPCIFDQEFIPFDQLNGLDERSLDIASYTASINRDGTCDRVVLFVFVDSPELRDAIAPFADAVEVRTLLNPL